MPRPPFRSFVHSLTCLLGWLVALFLFFPLLLFFFFAHVSRTMFRSLIRYRSQPRLHSELHHCRRLHRGLAATLAEFASVLGRWDWQNVVYIRLSYYASHHPCTLFLRLSAILLRSASCFFLSFASPCCSPCSPPCPLFIQPPAFPRLPVSVSSPFVHLEM